ncbi:MAG TPA: hypothetical protein VKB80_30295 [Kofleriaceae bacterium]|nr:hypothetical protein [Kofleriaceae bacterium]
MVSRVARRTSLALAALLAGVVLVAAPMLLTPRSARAEPGSSAPPAAASVLELKNLMTGPEYVAAGLEKLSAPERVLLDDWIGRLVVRLLTARQRRDCQSPIESRIDGEFEGWTGRTVVQLENGQVWRQRSATERYAYRVSPAVQVHRSASGCHMKVDGVAEEVPVDRLW